MTAALAEPSEQLLIQQEGKAGERVFTKHLNCRRDQWCSDWARQTDPTAPRDDCQWEEAKLSLVQGLFFPPPTRAKGNLANKRIK